MAKDPNVDPDELALFHREMRDVKRLSHDRVDHPRQRPLPVPKSIRRQDNMPAGRDSFSDGYDPCVVTLDDELNFIRPGVQKTVLRKLRRGHWVIAAELDLHGYIQSTARSALSEFLHTCIARGVRCVKIIHGKGHGSQRGRPVLKGRVNSWLRQHDEVLVFCSARPEDGGTGAVYVLLKNASKQRV